MIIQAVLFKRQKSLIWETGILLGHQDLIIDRNYKLVKEVKEYKPRPTNFSIDLTGIFNDIIEKRIL